MISPELPTFYELVQRAKEEKDYLKDPNALRLFKTITLQYLRGRMRYKTYDRVRDHIFGGRSLTLRDRVEIKLQEVMFDVSSFVHQRVLYIS